MDTEALKRGIEEYYQGDVTCDVVIEGGEAVITVSRTPRPVRVVANMDGSVASVGARFAYIIDMIDKARRCP